MVTLRKVGVLLLIPVLFSCGENQVKETPIVFPSFTTGIREEGVKCKILSPSKEKEPSWLKKKITVSMKEELPFSQVLYALGVGSVVFDDGTDEKVRIPFYKGTIGNLLKAYTDSRGYCLTFSGNVAVVKKECVETVKVPDWITENDLKKILTIKKLTFSYDPVGKVVILRGSKDVVETAKRVLREKTSTKINLRIFIGEITRKNSRESGIDWERILGEYSSVSQTSDTGTKNYLKFSVENGVPTFQIKTPHFNIQGLIGLLSKYANVKVVQNILISSGNGEEQEVIAGNKVPYVKEIGATVVGQNNAVQTMQTVTFGEVNSGIKVKVTPFYDKERGVIRLKLNIEDASIMGYVDLKSGQYEVSRPIVSEKSLKTTLSFSPDEVVVLTSMGKTSENISGNSLAGKFPYRKTEREKATLFVIVGAEVVNYECK